MPVCRRDQILNPLTNRCVLKSGKIGQQILANKRNQHVGIGRPIVANQRDAAITGQFFSNMDFVRFPGYWKPVNTTYRIDRNMFTITVQDKFKASPRLLGLVMSAMRNEIPQTIAYLRYPLRLHSITRRDQKIVLKFHHNAFEQLRRMSEQQRKSMILVLSDDLNMDFHR